VLQSKSEICDHFGISSAAEIGAYTLYRIDDFGVARFPVRKEKKDLGANQVKSGDFLILKNDADSKQAETLTLSLHRTMTGLPEHCEFVGTIDVSRELKLTAFKETLLDHMKLQTPPECVRIREKLNTTYFGKIYRDPNNKRNLKALGVRNNSHIVVQVMDEPEILDERTLVLLVCKRDAETRTYGPKSEHKFTWSAEAKLPQLTHLKAFCR